MDIEQMFELYESSDEEGRTKIIEDMKSEYKRLFTDNTELSGKNKSLQDMNRKLITTVQAPKVVQDADVQEEQPKIHMEDLFEDVVTFSR